MPSALFPERSSPLAGRVTARFGRLLFALTLVGCRKPVPQREAPLPAPTSVRAVSERKAPPQPKPTIAGRLFVDVSKGVRGFAPVGPKSASFKAFHRQIEVALAEAGVAAPTRCSLGAMVKCGPPPEDGGKRRCWLTAPVLCYPQTKMPNWADAGNYSADSSKLDSVLVPKPVQERVNPDEPPQPDWVDEAGLSVIVAGSVVPAAVDTGGVESSASACSGGPSPQCIGAALADRAKAGYGIWLISASLSFDGVYFADVPVNPSYVSAASAHLKEVKEIAIGEQPRFPGIDLRVGSQYPSGIPAITLSSFQYRGVRPLLVIALTRDVEQGRRFTASLVKRLSEDITVRPGAMPPEQAVHAIELAPLALASYRPAALALAARQSEDVTAAAQRDFLTLAPANVDAKGASIPIQCGERGKAWLLGQYAVLPAPTPLPPPVRQRPTLIGPLLDGKSPPAGLGRVEELPEGGGFRILSDCSVLGENGGEQTILWGLRRQVSIDEAALAKAWWSEQSAPNSYEMPERVYGLKEIVLSVLRLATIGNAPMGLYQLDVRRKR